MRKLLTYRLAALAISVWAQADLALAQDYCNFTEAPTYLCVLVIPGDPVAGNPSSLESRMIASDFRLGSFVGPSPDFASAGAGGAALPSLIGVGLGYSSVSVENFQIDRSELPFSFSRPLADPRYALVFDLPISYTEIQVGSFSFSRIYSASAGAGVRLAMLDNWTITPTLRLGAMYSVDDNITAWLGGASVVSNFTTSLGALDLSIGNQLSFIGTLPGSNGGYDLNNTVLRNGLGLGGPTAAQIFDRPVTWEASVVNTQYFGTDLFAENTTDVAVSFGSQNSENGVTWDSMRLGLTYTFSDTSFEGLELNFGYRF